MAWQDIVIAIVCFSFGFMLLPQIRSSLRGKHVNAWSAGMTTLGLYTIAVMFWTLELWVSTASDIFAGSVWLILWYLAVFKNRQ